MFTFLFQTSSLISIKRTGFYKSYLKTTFCFLSFFVSSIVISQNPIIFSSTGSTTWTVPTCVTQVTVEVWGGGGGGGATWSKFDPTDNGSSSAEACTAAGGGGGGGYSRRVYTVTPGQVYTINVGNGGNGGTVNSSGNNRANAGLPGGNSTFSGPATSATGVLTAFGGSGGSAANFLRSNCLGGCWINHEGVNGNGGTGGGGSSGTTTFNGGNGAAGVHSGSTQDRSGGGGGGAGSTANGGNASGITSGGNGGASGGGNGANGIVQPYGNGYLGTNGNNGNTIGGGGSGACGHNRQASSNANRSNIGGNGARGEVRITTNNSNQPTPTFSQVQPICSGANLSPLPTTSNEGITGTWSPALNNTTTTTYTFTASGGQCANPTQMTITVNSAITPTFNQVGPYCSGATINPLPTTSNNNITGNWSPTINNAQTTTYTFTPNTGQCASVTQMTITVNQAPTLTPLTNQSICSTGSATFSVTSNPTSVPFQWQYFDGTNWNNVANNTPSGFTYSNQTTTTLNISSNSVVCNTFQYRVVAGSSSCQSISSSGNLTVVRATRILPTGPQCSETELNFDACPSGAIYSWSVTPPSGTNASPLIGNSQTFSFIPVNNTGLNQTFSVTANVTYQGLSCTNNFSPTITSPPISGTLSASSIDLCIGNTATVTTTGNTGGTWSSSNTSIATINTNGIVTGVSSGTVTISYLVNGVSPCIGSSNATLDIIVTAAPDAGILSGTSNLCAGGTTSISTNGNLGGTWSSSDATVATIDANGTITALNNGTTIITYSVTSASCNASDIATYTIIVNSNSSAGTLSSTSTNICVGNTATVSTNGTTGGNWASSNSSVATIDANGIVTGISPGTVTITYTLNTTNCSSGNNSASLTITVIDLPDAGTISGSISICQGNTTTLTTNGNSGGTWSSSDPAIVTIDANGLVNGIATGSVTISYSVSSSSCASGDLATFVINVSPSANAGSLSGNTSICTGSTSTITTNGNTGGTWTSSNTSIATVNSNGEVTGLSAGTITLSYSVSITGCSIGDIETLTITVNPTPTLTPVSNQTLCSGLSSSPINVNATPTLANVSWTNSNTAIGLAASGIGNIPSFIPTNNGNTPLTSIITVSSSLNGCNSNQQTFNISIYNTPTVLVNSNSPICVNNTINLSSSNGSNYSWQGPNGFTSSSQNPMITNATIVMSGTYSVTVNSLSGNCPGTATINVIVNSLPVVSASSNSPACIGGAINLNSNLSNANAYSWVGPNNYSSNSANPIINNASANMAGNYTLTVQNSIGCVNASVVSVSLLPQPSAPIVSPTRLCQFAQANPLVAIPSTGGNLNWYGNNSTGGTGTLNSPTPSSATIGTYPYYVSQTINGCESPRSLLNVTILQAPTGIVNAIAPKCAPMCSRFVLSTSTTINQYQWNMGNGLVTTNNDTINHCYPNAGNYTISVKITDTSGCFNTLQFPNWVKVNENPTAAFSSTPNEVTLFDPEILFQNQSTGNSISSYNWNFGDLTGTSTSQPNIYHTYSNAGVYNVTLIVRTNEGCSDTAKGIIEVIDDFNVYIPNSFTPNDDDVNEEFYPIGTGISEDKYLMEIYDRWGELIFTSNKFSVHWKGLRANGSEPVLQDTYIYRITLQSNKGVSVNKIGHVKVIR